MIHLESIKNCKVGMANKLYKFKLIKLLAKMFKPIIFGLINLSSSKKIIKILDNIYPAKIYYKMTAC